MPHAVNNGASTLRLDGSHLRRHQVAAPIRKPGVMTGVMLVIIAPSHDGLVIACFCFVHVQLACYSRHSTCLSVTWIWLTGEQEQVKTGIGADPLRP